VSEPGAETSVGSRLPGGCRLDPSLRSRCYQDPSLAPEKRSADLLARMTRDEKMRSSVRVGWTLDPRAATSRRSGMFMNTPIDQRELLAPRHRTDHAPLRQPAGRAARRRSARSTRFSAI